MVIRRRRYAVHMKNNLPTIEGLLMGRRNGHYLLAKAQILEGVDRTISLQGEVEVPRENVYCFEEIRS